MSDSGYSGSGCSGSGHQIPLSDGHLSNKYSDKGVTEQQKKLLEASKTGDLQEMKRLVEECHVEPGTCREPSPHQDTPIHLAAYHGHLNVVKYLIKIKIKDGKCDVKTGLRTLLFIVQQDKDSWM